ncbi:MAG: acetylornithine deacetylase [Thiolinea sp.]
MKSINTLQHLNTLVGFDTTSRQSNLELIHYVQNYLADYGVDSTLIYNEDGGDRANLYATIGPHDVGGVLLSGHTDVVPVTGQAWDSDPYQLTDRDGTLYGRGSSDMKGFIAATLAAVPEMVAQRLQTPLHLAFSYDEEIGCVGAKNMVEKLKLLEVKPKLGVIGEPTLMQSIVGHKGKGTYKVTFTGFSCHSAYLDDGVNAIEFAAKLLLFIQQMNQKLVARGQTDSGYSVDHSTFQTGVISGGTVVNIVPRTCEFVFEIRNLPQFDVAGMLKEITDYAYQEVLPEMRARNEEADIRFENLSAYPGMHTHTDSACVGLVTSLTEHACSGEKVSFGTEGGLFQQHLDVDCVVCGPGSIEQAHKPNEFIHRGQLDACDTFLARLINTCQTSM